MVEYIAINAKWSIILSLTFVLGPVIRVSALRTGITSSYKNVNKCDVIN